MRRVYDDKHYSFLSAEIMITVGNIDPRSVSEYDWGTYRAQRSLIVDRILDDNYYIKLGKSANTTGIGNNWCHELVYTGECEEQIFGLLHITDDMYGTQIVWVSDIDGERKTHSIKIKGTH